MASTSVCASCLSALRQQVRRALHHQPSPSTLRTIQRQQPFSPRPLSTSTTVRQQQPQTQQQRPPPPPPPKSSSPAAPAGFAHLASSLRHANTGLLRKTTEPYIAYGSTEDLFRACAAQCTYTIPSVLASPRLPPRKNAAEEDVGVGEGWWVSPKSAGGLGLDVTFNAWAQVVMLHMYLLTVRLRCFPKEHAAIWHQNLLDHFFYAAEDRMAVWHGMSARGVRNKYLKDLWLQWRGLLLSYDEGLIKGDAVLAAAVWRNMFKAGEEVEVVDVAIVTAYMRRELQRLGEMSDEVVSEGKVAFGRPETLKAVVNKESPWMRRSFTAEDLKGLEEKK